MFQEISPAATDGQKSTSSISVRHVSGDIGVSPEREQLKSVPSSSTMPKGTPKSNLDMEQIKSYVKAYDEHMTDKEEGREEELQNTHINDMKDISVHFVSPVDLFLDEYQYVKTLYLKDEHNAATEAGCTEELNIQHSPDRKYLEIPPDFSDAQLREIKAAKAREAKKSPVKRDRKKSKVFRSPYITKFGSSSKDKGSSANEEKQMYAFDGCTIYEELPNQLINDYSQWLEIGLLKYHASNKRFGLSFYYKIKDCGVFVAAYAKILSEEQQVHLCEFEVARQRARYASLLWHYEVTWAKKGYTSDNDDPPRPKNTFLQSLDESAIITLE
ncbi:hypothetical protein FXO38_04039 [Capsicum annuum]|nr:hypothetical protein FXO38_04039 [Capsicum annuum]